MLSKNLSKILLILIGSSVWSVTMVKSGLFYPFGLGFWGPNGHDGIWHISLVESLSRGSWDMPIFAGEAIKNYHIGYDVFLALLHKLTSIPVITLYFQVLPPLTALLIGFLVYQLVELVWKNKTTAWWAVFFTYFGGSLGWLVSLFQNRGWGGESMFWAQQSISTLINPPFAASLVLIFSGLICLLQFYKSKKKLWLFPIVILLSLTSVTKIYSGIITLVGLGLMSIYEIITVRKFQTFFITLVVGIFSALLFFPLNLTSTSLIHFQPFWFLETLMALSDRLDWPKFYQAMTTYRMSSNLLKGIPAYLLAFLIFVIGNFGTRIFLIASISKPTGKFSPDTAVKLFLVQGIILGILFPLLFVQAGTPWNTIQFFYYSQIFAGVIAGAGFYRLLTIKNRWLVPIIITLAVAFTVPTSLNSLQNYLPARPPAMISHTELEALNILQRQPSGVVLTSLFDSGAASAAEVNPPRPLYLYVSTAYVSAFTSKPTYLEDEINLNITNYDWQNRRKSAEDFFASTDPVSAREFLTQNNIQYIYLAEVARFRPKLSASQIGFTSLFENSQSAIWQKDPSEN